MPLLFLCLCFYLFIYTASASAFPQVQGYVVEEIFFDYAKEYNIAVLNNSVSCVNQVQQLGLNEANLSLDVLYRLRMYRPVVIDAVGIFSQGDNTADLVYFQVSISSYDGHSTKINDLFASNYKTKGYSELTAKYPSIHEYYKGKAPRDPKCVTFIYQQQQPVGKLEEDALKHGIVYAVLSTEASLYKQLKLC